MISIACNRDILSRTIAALRAGGARSEERVVLWLAPANASRVPIEIVEVYEPAQICDVDFFNLPPESLRALMTHLRANRLKIAAQVHSHPGGAFHSEADDRWAIVRHVGGLSLVLPRFAAEVTVDSFAEMAATYALSPNNEWLPVSTASCMETRA